MFHIIDHSYSQLAHRLPAGRTIVTCHDLDTFRSLLHPAEEPRSRPYNLMMRHVLAGLRRAAPITCDTATVRAELIEHRLAEPGHVIVAPVAVGPEFSHRPDPEADRAAARLVGAPLEAPVLLHVGSTIPRKRIDVLLRTFAELCAERPQLRLVRVGGPFTGAQAELARQLGVAERIVTPSFLDDRTLAAIYRRATLVLLPSDREGFGLPLVEAMAAGTPVVASDLATQGGGGRRGILRGRRGVAGVNGFSTCWTSGSAPAPRRPGGRPGARPVRWPQLPPASPMSTTMWRTSGFARASA